MFCTSDKAGSDCGNNANATSCKELNCYFFMGSKRVLFYTVAWMYISSFIQNLKCWHSAQRKHGYPLFSEMKIAQISCKQRHTSVGYTSVAMVTRGSCFSVNSCSCHPIYPPLSLHFPSIWHQGQINKVDKQLKYRSSFWSHCTSVFSTQRLHRTTLARISAHSASSSKANGTCKEDVKCAWLQQRSLWWTRSHWVNRRRQL